MAKSLKCAVLFSLKEIALRRITTLFFNNSDISASILYLLEFRFLGSRDWQIGTDIMDKISNLNLPKSLTKLMIDNIPIIGLEIIKWKNIHKAFFESSHIAMDPAKLCWTTAGTIDYGKTAKELAHCDELNVEQRYNIACQYCLENDISLLWDELSENLKEFYLNKQSNLDLEFCWPHIIRGDLSYLDFLWTVSDRNLTSFNQWAFEDSAENGNIPASEYFFQKLTQEEKDASIMRTGLCAPGYRNGRYWLTVRRFDILQFLLCLMTPEQQMEIVKARPVDVILCFLDSPQQDLFVANAGLIWTFLPPSDYENLLQEMATIIDSDIYFPKLLQNFLQQSPLAFKKYFVEGRYWLLDSPVSRFVSLFFDSEDSESLKVIFRNIDAADRVKLLFKEDMLELYCNCIMSNKLHMVEVCLWEAALTKNDRERLKEIFENYLHFIGMMEIKCLNREWQRFLESFDETSASFDT